MEISNVADVWASDAKIRYIDRVQVALLRLGGCTCQFPVLRRAINDYDGPRCKVCGIQVLLIPPTEEEILTYKRLIHKANKNFLASAGPEFTEKHPEFKILDECYEGCGCNG